MTNCMQVHYIKYCNVQTIIINVNCKITLRVFLYLGTVDYAELSFWIILLDKAEIRDSILKLDYSWSALIVHFNKISWIIMRGDEVQTAVMCVDVSICLWYALRIHFIFGVGCFVVVQLDWYTKPVIPPLNASGTLCMINPTATAAVFRAQLHINYYKCCNNLLKTNMYK